MTARSVNLEFSHRSFDTLFFIFIFWSPLTCIVPGIAFINRLEFILTMRDSWFISFSFI